MLCIAAGTSKHVQLTETKQLCFSKPVQTENTTKQGLTALRSRGNFAGLSSLFIYLITAMKKKLLNSLICLSVAFYMSMPGSIAQLNWTKSQAAPLPNPVFSWTSSGIPFVYITEIQDTLRMWFTGADGNPAGNDRIGYANSVDGIIFNYLPVPVLEPGGVAGNFDSEGVFGASVIFDGTTYRMWYNGYNTQPYYAGNIEAGLATSADGINWTKHAGNPVLPKGNPGDFDMVWAYVNTVLFENGVYKMWYTGFNGSTAGIGYATSTDGITWLKHPGNPVIAGGGPGTGSLLNVQNPCVIHTDAGYGMWFNGNGSDPDFHVYYASSADGIAWTCFPVPVLTTGDPGSFDQDWAWHPNVIFDDGVYRMWYSGYNGTEWAIGMATDSTLAGMEDQWEAAGLQPSVKFYPNPAVDHANFEIHLVTEQMVRVDLYDIQGFLIASSPETKLSAGDQTISVDLKHHSPGFYYCTITGSNFRFTGKVVAGR